MTLRRSRPFIKQYTKLHPHVRNKLHRQLKTLTTNYRHPSLHTKRIRGAENVWEARIDYKHRFTFQVTNNIIILRKVGPHDILKKP